MSGSFIRRATPAVLLTGAAVGLVALFDPALGAIGTTPVASQAAADTAAGSGTPSGTTTDSGSTGSGSAASGTTTTSGCDSATEVVGDAASTPWGPVQVAALVADGQVCSVSAIEYPMNDHHSQEINSYAIPALDAAASTDGTGFQAVSGATYTSEGYRSSLQSILDQL